jgi:hypothetical protein
MNQRLLIPLLTALGFVAGFIARSVTESGPSVPPPPVAAGTEFVRPNATADTTARRAPTYTEQDRTKLVADIEKIRPQIEAYRKRIDEIGAEFDRDLVPILSAEQREKFSAIQKRFAEHRAKGERETANAVTLSDEQIFQLQQRPLWHALWNVAINWRLDRLKGDLGLSAEQQEKVRGLLQQRRDKFLALVDSSPPPSITLSQLAAQASKLATKPAK